MSDNQKFGSDININDLIQHVVRQHSLLLSKDDPILVSVTMYEFVIRAYLKQVFDETQKLQRTIITINSDAKEAATAQSEKLISEASAYVTQQLDEAASRIIKDMRKAMGEAVSKPFSFSQVMRNPTIKYVLMANAISFLFSAFVVAYLFFTR